MKKDLQNIFDFYKTIVIYEMHNNKKEVYNEK